MGNHMCRIAEDYESRVSMLKQDFLQPELSDESLAARIAQHDINALGIIYDRFAPRVFTLAAMLSDCTDAERIVLDVFSRLWLQADQIKFHDGSFQDWFLSLARSQIVNEVVGNGRRTAQDRVDAISRWLSDATDEMLKATDGFHQPSSRIRVWQGLQILPVEQRCVIILASYGGFKLKEIALLLSLPLYTIDQYIRLGLKRLRDSTKTEQTSERG